MDLFDEGEVTTADKIQRPQSALDRQMFEDFKKRNPMSDGGPPKKVKMVYDKKTKTFRPRKDFSGMTQEERTKKFSAAKSAETKARKATKRLKDFVEKFKKQNNRLPSQQEIMRMSGGKSETIQKYLTEGVDYATRLSKQEAARLGGAPIPKHVVKAGDQEGVFKLINKVKKLNRVNKLEDKGVRFVVRKTQAGNFTPGLFYGGYGSKESFGSIEDLKTELNKFKKTDDFKTYNKSTIMQLGGIKSAEKQLENIGSKKREVFEYLLNNKNATVQEISKTLKIPEGKVTKTLQGLYSDIYKRVADQGAVFLKKYDINQLDSVHDSIKNSKVKLKDRVKNLVIDAYKGDENLKPILKKLDDFYALQSQIKKTPYGKFYAANLDHVVPLNFLRELEKGVSPMDLIRVRPIPEFLNQRAFKSQFDRVLGQAYANRLKPGGKKTLESIVNLQSYLPKEFGGITPDGKIKDYGAKPFSLKTNLSQADFPEIYKRVFEFIENPELQETFKQSKVSFKKLLSQKKQIAAATKQFNKANLQRFAAIGCPGKIMGGRVKLAEGQNLTRCAVRGINKLQTTDPKNLTLADRANYQAIRKTSQGARLLKNVLGPAALGIEALFVAPFAAADYASGRPGRDIALSALSFGLADKKLKKDELKKIYSDYGKGQELLDLDERLQELERQFTQGTRGQRIRSKGLLEEGLKEFDEAVKEFPTRRDLFNNLERSEQAEQELQRQYDIRKKQRTSSFDLSDPFSAAGGGIAKLAGVDSGPPPPAGPNSQGLQGLMKRVKKL